MLLQNPLHYQSTTLRQRIVLNLPKMQRSFARSLVLALALLAPCLTVAANKNNWRDPNSMFSAEDNYTNQVLVKWHYTDNLQKTCETESRKRGHGGFGYPLDACSFWSKSFFGTFTCDIYTERKTNLHFLGHEIRHCFQRNFH